MRPYRSLHFHECCGGALFSTIRRTSAFGFKLLPIPDLSINGWTKRTVICPAGSVALSNAVALSVLQYVDLYSCHQESDGWVSVFKACTISSTLTALYVYGTNVTDAAVMALASGLRTNRTILFIQLGCNRDIGRASAVSLADALKTNTTVTSLDLDGNRIGSFGAMALAHTFRSNRSVVSLRLRECLIGNKGAMALAEMLRINSVIRIDGLCRNDIDAVGLYALYNVSNVQGRISDFGDVIEENVDVPVESDDDNDHDDDDDDDDDE